MVRFEGFIIRQSLGRAIRISNFSVALKQKLTGTTAELVTYKEKVQKLQNDLIKKNQKEEDYLRVSWLDNFFSLCSNSFSS